jgi:hypothetical protein
MAFLTQRWATEQRSVYVLTQLNWMRLRVARAVGCDRDLKPFPGPRISALVTRPSAVHLR